MEKRRKEDIIAWRSREKAPSMTNHLFNDAQGAEKVDGGAAFIGVADELSVQLLVTSKGNASSLLVVIVEQFFVGGIEFANALVGHPVHAVNSEFGKANGNVTVDIDRTVLVGDKNLKSRRKLVKRFSHASVLDRFYEFFIADFTILVKISQLSDLVPQVSHDLLVLLESGLIPLALAFNDGVTNGQAFEVVLVQCTIAVNVVHVPDDELDAVVPRVSHYWFLWVCTD